MYVIEQPLPAAPAADSQAQVLSQWNAVYDAYNEVACLLLGSMTPELHRQFENSSPYDMDIKELNLFAAYVLQMKGYVDQLERLGYMLPQDLISAMFILNGLTKDFARFVVKSRSPINNCLKLKARVKLMARESINKAISLSLKTLSLLLKSTKLRMTPATTARRWVIRRGTVLSIFGG
ncbi:hypothetical protein Tco_0744784, partial [Tanacetum coccineum]